MNEKEALGEAELPERKPERSGGRKREKTEKDGSDAVTLESRGFAEGRSGNQKRFAVSIEPVKRPERKLDILYE